MQKYTVMSGAEPFFFKRGKVGLVLSHGFTGTPKEVLELGVYLAENNITVLGPRLPGHGTDLKDMLNTTANDWVKEYTKSYKQLEKHCEEIFVGGLSLGGLLSHNHAINHDVQGIISMAAPINLGMFIKILLALFAPLAKKRSIKKSKEELELAEKLNNLCYVRDPIGPANSLRKFMKSIKNRLGEITEPIMILQGMEDTRWIIDSAKVIHDTVSSKKKELIFLEKSPHCLTIGPEKEKVKKLVFEFIKRNSSIEKD